jgi:periplasmic divalent cation tolerance protein
MDTGYIVVLITVPHREEAEAIAEALVREGWAACVNILPAVHSIFTWQGEIQKEGELLLLAKTKGHLFASLASRVKELHPYTVPEIIALPIVEGWKEYLEWVEESTRRQGP